MTSDPYAAFKGDKCSINVSADKGGTLRYKGGSMDFDAVCQPNQFIEISNEGGSVLVRTRFKPKPVALWQITEALLEGTLQEKVTKIADLFDVPVTDEKE